MTSWLCLLRVQGKNKARRVKTIYDCQADNDDELTFAEGEVIIVTGEEDQEWWVSPAPVLTSQRSLRHHKQPETHTILLL